MTAQRRIRLRLPKTRIVRGAQILLNELRNIASKLNKSPRNILSYKKYAESGGVYSISTFQNHFGSWKLAVSKIGLLDGHSGRYSDEELFLELQRLWEGRGQQPTFREMEVNGRISGKIFQKRFGSWTAAVHAFCDDRQSERDDATRLPVEPEADVETISTPIEIDKSQFLRSDVLAIAENTLLVDRLRVAGPRLRFRVLHRDGFRCVFCGRRPDPDGVTLQADHVFPWSRGGLTVLENLRAACAECNTGKSDLIL